MRLLICLGLTPSLLAGYRADNTVCTSLVLRPLTMLHLFPSLDGTGGWILLHLICLICGGIIVLFIIFGSSHSFPSHIGAGNAATRVIPSQPSITNIVSRTDHKSRTAPGYWGSALNSSSSRPQEAQQDTTPHLSR